MISKREIEQLGKNSALRSPVLSLYLNTDRKSPEGVRYLAQLRRLLTLSYKKLRAERKDAEHLTEILHSQILPRLMRFLDEEVVPYPSIRSVAVFISLAKKQKTKSEEIVTFTLPKPLKSQSHLAPNAYVSPLLFLLDQYEQYAVVTADQRRARFLLVSLGEISHCMEFSSDTPHHHDQGGFSQKRFERRFDRALEKHVKKLAGYTVKYLSKQEANRLILGGDPDILRLFKEILPKDLREKVVGFVASKPHESKYETLERTLEIAKLAEKEAEDLAVKELVSAMAEKGKAVTGSAKVLSAVNERRARKIIIKYGYGEKGAVCSNCQSFFLEGKTCPTCNRMFTALDDVLEEAVEKAHAEETEIEFVEDNIDLEALGNVGAILRF